MSLLPIGNLKFTEIPAFGIELNVWNYFLPKAVLFDKKETNEHYLLFYKPLMPEGKESYTISMVQYRDDIGLAASLLLTGQSQERLFSWKGYKKEWFLVTIL